MEGERGGGKARNHLVAVVGVQTRRRSQARSLRSGCRLGWWCWRWRRRWRWRIKSYVHCTKTSSKLLGFRLCVLIALEQKVKKKNLTQTSARKKKKRKEKKSHPKKGKPPKLEVPDRAQETRQKHLPYLTSVGSLEPRRERGRKLFQEAAGWSAGGNAKRPPPFPLTAGQVTSRSSGFRARLA